jgi:nucleoside phosphorylase
MSRIAIIAAMEREVKPLIRSWKMRMMEQGGRQYRLFEQGEVGLICGGMGPEAARRATEAVIGELKPQLVISVGFAGALDGSLQVGDVFEPRAVINASDGVRTEMGSGRGLLVSSSTVADKEQKSRFRKAYGASAVDMEAAAVAQGAQARGVKFGALKAISDTVDFTLPPIDRFVAADGSFHAAKFAGYLAVRPLLWGTVIGLARNSSKASRALCDALRSYLNSLSLDRRSPDGQPPSREASRDESSEPELNQNNVSAESDGVHTHTGIQSHT